MIEFTYGCAIIFFIVLMLALIGILGGIFINKYDYETGITIAWIATTIGFGLCLATLVIF